MLTIDDIFLAKPKCEEFSVPEWGGTIMIRPITLEEQGKLADLTRKFADANNTVKLREISLSLLLWACCNADGEPLFSKDNIPKLAGSPAAAIMRIQEQILRISGLTEETRKELEKNSLTGLDSGPSS